MPRPLSRPLAHPLPHPLAFPVALAPAGSAAPATPTGPERQAYFGALHPPTSLSLLSTNVPSAPRRATTSTIPDPMSPQPTTPTCRTSPGSMVLRPKRCPAASLQSPGWTLDDARRCSG